MADNKKTIQISEELYQALQDLKKLFTQLTGQQNLTEEDVIWILVSWFIESLNQQQSQGNIQQGGWQILTE